MKSELFGTDKLQVDPRPPLQRRRMSKPTLMNGEFKLEVECQPNPVNMVAAIHDHISCTKSSDFLKVPESREEKIALACELDHMYANCSAEPRLSKEENVQIKHLKDLALLHLDFIQQQHEQLTLKDRQLAALRQERDALQQRLSRTEHRVSVLRQRRTKKDEPLLNSLKSESNETNNETVSTKVGESNVWPEDAIPKITSRQKNLSCSTDAPGSSLSSSQSQETASVGDPASLKICSTTQTSSSVSSGSSRDQKLALDTRIRKQQDILQTDVLYHTSCGDSLEEEETSQEDDVQVPTWRVHAIASCYSMEGTENLDDDIYLKRHHKQEADERRRKRWDVQRFREIRYQEKLKQGRSVKKKPVVNDQGNMDSFYPSLDDVLYIEVTETVPVCAFGATVPALETREFSCPWLDDSKNNLKQIEEENCQKIKRRKYRDRSST